MNIMYWVFFEKDTQPTKIVATTAQDFSSQLRDLILKNEQMPEWICRVYR